MPTRPVHELIDALSRVLIQISDKVVVNIDAALETIRTQDAEGVRRVRMVDREIDMAEVDLESRCLSFLALQQPVARDLRTIITIIKINDDLERIGDLAVHIVDRMDQISPDMIGRFRFDEMGQHAGKMVKLSIDAFMSRDRVLADQVCALDEEIDVMHRAVFKQVTSQMKMEESDVSQLIAVLSISRYLERMADHASRIAIEVIYLVTGEIVRHSGGSYEKMIGSFK